MIHEFYRESLIVWTMFFYIPLQLVGEPINQHIVIVEAFSISKFVFVKKYLKICI